MNIRGLVFNDDQKRNKDLDNFCQTLSNFEYLDE